MTEKPQEQTSLDEETPSVHDTLDEARARADQRIAEREARRESFAQVTPEPKPHLVAWVDLLGFSEQILAADTPETYQAAFRRMHQVHEFFDKETASPELDQAEVNATLGKRVIALSDGLVIASDLDREDDSDGFSSFYDRVGFFLEDLRLAQALCAHQGNFLRGGIARGLFWFEDDILLSPALVSAYRLEDKIAKMPVIILERELAEKIRETRSQAGYAEDFDPMEKLFRDCDWMAEPGRTKYVMLDFMQAYLFDGDDPRGHLNRYRNVLVAARNNAPETARPKYDWLLRYALEFVEEELPGIDNMFAEKETGFLRRLLRWLRNKR